MLICDSSDKICFLFLVPMPQSNILNLHLNNFFIFHFIRILVFKNHLTHCASEETERIWQWPRPARMSRCVKKITTEGVVVKLGPRMTFAHANYYKRFSTQTRRPCLSIAIRGVLSPYTIFVLRINQVTRNAWRAVAILSWVPFTVTPFLRFRLLYTTLTSRTSALYVI